MAEPGFTPKRTIKAVAAVIAACALIAGAVLTLRILTEKGIIDPPDFIARILFVFDKGRSEKNGDNEFFDYLRERDAYGFTYDTEHTVSPENINALFKSMTEPESFYRESEVTFISGDKSRTVKYVIYKSGGSVRIEASDGSVNKIILHHEDSTVIINETKNESVTYKSDKGFSYFDETGILSAAGLPEISQDDISEFAVNLNRAPDGADAVITFTSGGERYVLTVSLDNRIVTSAEIYRGENCVYRLRTDVFTIGMTLPETLFISDNG